MIVRKDVLHVKLYLMIVVYVEVIDCYIKENVYVHKVLMMMEYQKIV